MTINTPGLRFDLMNICQSHNTFSTPPTSLQALGFAPSRTPSKLTLFVELSDSPYSIMSDQSRAESVNHVAVACGVIETIAVCLRLLARWKTRAQFAVDDWLVVATLIPSYAMLVLGSFSTSLSKVFRKRLT